MKRVANNGNKTLNNTEGLYSNELYLKQSSQNNLAGEAFSSPAVRQTDQQIENIHSKVIKQTQSDANVVPNVYSHLPVEQTATNNTITKVIDIELPEEVEESEMKFLLRTIEELKAEDAKLGPKFSENSRYFYRGQQIYPKVKMSKQVSFSERVVSEKSVVKKEAEISSERVRAASNSEVEVRDDDLHYSRVDETDEYVEFMKEISTNTYKPTDFVQVEWGKKPWVFVKQITRIVKSLRM